MDWCFGCGGYGRYGYYVLTDYTLVGRWMWCCIGGGALDLDGYGGGGALDMR